MNASTVAALEAAGQNAPGSEYIASAQEQTAAAPTSGPAAWDDKWAAKFTEAGVPAEVVQQLTFSGANGADAAKLQEMLDTASSEIESGLAEFQHKHPEEFDKLRSNPKIDRATLAQVAMAVNSGGIPDDQLAETVEQLSMTPGKMLMDTLVKPMAVWSLIPGWGALRLAAAPFTGGKDPLTGEKMFDGGMMTAFTGLAALGGAFTLANHARGAMQVAQGQRLAAAGGDAARIAANEGVENLQGFQKFASFVPGTNANKVYAGIGRLDENLSGGMKNLQGVERELAENVLAKWRNGDISIVGDSASKFGFMGYQPNARGILINGKKAMAATSTAGSKPVITLDNRMTGKTIAAHIASVGVDHADDALKAKLFGPAGAGKLSEDALKAAREQTLGRASQQLMDSGFISRPGGMSKAFGWLRPGPLQDAMYATDNLAKGTIGKGHGFAGIPKAVKFGAGGLAAAGGGYYMMVKAPQDAAKKQAAEAEKAQKQQQNQGGAAAGGAAAGGAAAGSATAAPTMTPELQAALQEFSALPADQQAAILEQQRATLEQAAAQPGLTAEQQGEIVNAAQELELFVQVAGAAAGTTAAPTAGTIAPTTATMAPATTAPMATAAPAVDPATGVAPVATAPTAAPTASFTPQGLGLQ